MDNKKLMSDRWEKMRNAWTMAGADYSLAKHKSNFSTGGVVHGPQMALLGSNEPREEFIIPAHILDMLGHTNPTVISADIFNVLRVSADKKRENE